MQWSLLQIYWTGYWGATDKHIRKSSFKMSKVFLEKMKNRLENRNIRLYNKNRDIKTLWKPCPGMGNRRGCMDLMRTSVL